MHVWRAAPTFAVVVVAVVAIVAAVSIVGFHSPPSEVSATTQSTVRVLTPTCSSPCAVWTKSGGSSYEALALSPDDSYVVYANASGIYTFDGNGTSMWHVLLDHQVASIAISSNGAYIAIGGWQTLPGPAAAYANGEVYLFTRDGKMLWSDDMGSSNPIFKVVISADGSSIVAMGEQSISYLGSTGITQWSYPAISSNIGGLAMSPDGNLVVASTDKVIAFNGLGYVLWTYPLGGQIPVSTDSIAISSNESAIWVGSAYSGYNGTLSLFDREGNFMWQREVSSPALFIQTGSNLTAFVETNWGALLYGADGSLLRNITSSTLFPVSSTCNGSVKFTVDESDSSRC
jgi:hypothetical protein